MTLWVYFIRPVGQGGPIKIGCSRVPVERLKAIMTWAPIPLEIVATIVGDRKLERRLHGIFAETHSHREWFHFSPRLTALIADLAAGTPIEQLIDLDGPVLKFRTRKRHASDADRRLYLSFAARVRWAIKKARAAGHGADYAPQDVDAVLDRWGRRGGHSPTTTEIARLEQVISDPAAHCLTRQQRWPAPRAA